MLRTKPTLQQKRIFKQKFDLFYYKSFAFDFVPYFIGFRKNAVNRHDARRTKINTQFKELATDLCVFTPHVKSYVGLNKNEDYKIEASLRYS